MTTIRKLQEVSTVSEAEVILRENKAGPAVRRLVETGIALKNHADPNQRQLGATFILDAIREVEEDDDKIKEGNGAVKPMNSPSAGEKDLDKKINEEVLSNHNPNTANAGSDQSSDNTPPYPAEGTDAPQNDMEGMKSAGFYAIPWFPQIGAGIYFYTLESLWQKRIGKLVLIGGS